MKKNISILLVLVMIATLGISLIACDKTPDQVTITFMTNGGSAIDSVVLKQGDALDIPNLVPKKAGKKFVGWFYDEALTQAYDKTKELTGDFTLYAKYVDLQYYTITFEMNGGSDVNPVKFREDKKPKLPTRLSRTDYVFDSWYFDEALTKKYDENKLPGGSFKLYAAWVRANEVSVNFETNGNYDLKRKVIAKETALGELENPRDTVKVFFDGWYLDKEYTIPYTADHVFPFSATVYGKTSPKKNIDDFVGMIKKTLNETKLNEGFNVTFKSDFVFKYDESSKKDIALGFEMQANMFGNKSTDLGFRVVDIYDNNKVLFGLYTINNQIVIQNDNTYYTSPVNFNLTQLFMDLLFKAQVGDLPNNIMDIILTPGSQFETIEDIVDMLSALSIIFDVDYNRTLVAPSKYAYNYVLDTSFERISAVIDLVRGVAPVPQVVLDLAKILEQQNVVISTAIDEMDNGILNTSGVEVVVNNTDTSGNGKLTGAAEFNIGEVKDNVFNITSDNLTKVEGYSQNATIAMKDKAGNVIGHYTATIKANLPMTLDLNVLVNEFTAAGFNLDGITDITEQLNSIRRTFFDDNNFVQTKKFLSDLLKHPDAKLYIDFAHNCDSTCKLGHAGIYKAGETPEADLVKKDHVGSVLSIAYDKSSFETNKIYVSMNLRSILPKDFAAALGELGLSAEVANTVKSVIDQFILPASETVGFAIDPVISYNIFKDNTPAAPKTKTMSATSYNASAATPQKSGLDQILVMLAKYLVLGEPSTINLDAILGDILPALGENAKIINVIRNLLLPNVSTIDLSMTKAKYTKFDDNVKDLFAQQSTGVNKTFDNAQGNKNSLPTGEITIVKDEKGAFIFEGLKPIYATDADGNKEATMTVKEASAIFKDFKLGSNSLVKIQYTNIFGVTETAMANVVLAPGQTAPTEIGKHQIKLVAHNNTSTFNELYKFVAGMFLDNLLPGAILLAFQDTVEFELPVNVIAGKEIKFTNTDPKEDELAYDSSKVYNTLDKINTQFIATAVYDNGFTKELGLTENSKSYSKSAFISSQTVKAEGGHGPTSMTYAMAKHVLYSSSNFIIVNVIYDFPAVNVTFKVNPRVITHEFTVNEGETLYIASASNNVISEENANKGLKGCPDAAYDKAYKTTSYKASTVKFDNDKIILKDIKYNTTFTKASALAITFPATTATGSVVYEGVVYNSCGVKHVIKVTVNKAPDVKD